MMFGVGGVTSVSDGGMKQKKKKVIHGVVNYRITYK